MGCCMCLLDRLRFLRISGADGMNRQDVVRDMKKEIGSFPNISQIAKYLSVSRDKVREMVDGLEYLEDGRSRKYFINDVADRILQNRRN